MGLCVLPVTRCIILSNCIFRVLWLVYEGSGHHQWLTLSLSEVMYYLRCCASPFVMSESDRGDVFRALRVLLIVCTVACVPIMHYE